MVTFSFDLYPTKIVQNTNCINVILLSFRNVTILKLRKYISSEFIKPINQYNMYLN